MVEHAGTSSENPTETEANRMRFTLWSRDADDDDIVEAIRLLRTGDDEWQQEPVNLGERT